MRKYTNYDVAYETGISGFRLGTGFGARSELGGFYGAYSVNTSTKYISPNGIYSISNLVKGNKYCEDDYYLYYKRNTTIAKIPKEEYYNEIKSLADAPYVVYNDSILAFETPPVIENGTTLIPIRFLFEQMGAEVDWDSDTRTATISKDGTVITFMIDNTTATVNGEPAEMTVPAQLINDKTMVPVRFLSEELGYTVTWDGDNRIITIE